MENFTRGSLSQSISGIWRKVGRAILGLAVMFAFANTASAQIIHNEDFQGATGWTLNGFLGTATLPCESTQSVRDNIYSGVSYQEMISPLFTSNGLLVNMSFDYKVVDWSAATNPTPATFGTILVQYGATTTGPWTTVHTIDNTNHTPSATCATPSFSFTPPAGNTYFRINITWNAGDYYLYFDDIDIVQNTPTCSGAPSTPTAAISSTSGCDGAGLTLTATGLDVGTGLSQQWEYSSDNFVSDINDLTGETSATANISSPASTVYYRIRHECNDVPSIVYSNIVSYAGVSCASVVVPFTGSSNNACGTDAVITDHAGAGSNYNVNAGGHLVLQNTPGSFITLSGDYDMESGWDFIYIYDGAGTGGTLLQTLTGAGSMTPISGTDGQILTIELVSDASVTAPGFEFQALYSGTCLLCSGTPAGGTAAIDDPDGCQNAPIELSATGFETINIDYQWQYSSDNFVSDINDVVGGTATTVNTNAPGTTGITYYRLRSRCTDSGLDGFSTVVTYTATSCGAFDLPGTSGSNNSHVCGTNTWFYDDAGGATNYQNGFDSYSVLDASGTAQINLSGDYDMESGWDYIYIYYGVGTAGTQVPGSPFTGTGSIDITGNVGEALTVRLDSDASVNRPGFAFEVIYSGTCAACTAPPAGGTIAIPSTTGCSGGTMTLTSSGLDIGPDNTYQWQVSNDNFVSDVNDITGETGQTYDLTTVSGLNYYRLQSFCSADLGQPAYSNIVSFDGFTCTPHQVPATGSSTVSCGVTTSLTDDGGPTGNYSNGTDGYTVFEINGSASVAFSGTYDMENGWDFLRIYEGVGTGGSLLYSYTGAGSITPFTNAGGVTAITIEVDSDASVNRPGIDLIAVYSGTCDPCAAAPSVQAATLVTNNSATINWNAATTIPGVGYEWEVRTSGLPGSGPTGLVATGTTNNSTLSVALGAILSGNTTYSVYARSECTAGTDYSTWNGSVDFTTACDPEAAPTAEETFDTYTGFAPAPVCWAEAENQVAPATAAAITEGNGTSWVSTTGFGNTGSDAGAKVNLYGTTDSDWLISQPIDLGGTPNLYRVAFNMLVTNWNGTTVQTDMGSHEMHLIISLDGGATWDAANILHTFTGVGSYGLQEFAVDLTTQTGVVRFALIADDNGFSPDIDFHVDDFVVEVIPSCFEPTVTAATNITNSSATLNWTAATPTPTNYEWEVRTSGAGGSGATGLVDSGTTPDGTTVTANTTATLAGDTEHFIYVRSFCGGSDYSVWNGPISFRTLCDPEVAPTVNEDFVGFVSTPTSPFNPLPCWNEGNGPIGTPSTITDGNSSWVAVSGFGNIGSDAAAKQNVYGGDPGDWLISQPIDLGVTAGVYRVSYDMTVTNWNSSTVAGSMGSHVLNVLISLDGGVTWNAADVLASYTGAGTYSATTYTHDLTTQTGVVRIAFVNVEGGFSPDIDVHIDDFIVEAIPPCLEPGAASAENITDQTATINWVEPGTLPGVGYEYEVRSSGVGGSGATGLDASGSEAVGTDFAAVTGLTANTFYTVYVRSECTAGTQYSTWVAVTTFTTQCTPEVAPTAIETFDSYSGNAPDPLCWSEGTGAVGSPSTLTIANSNWANATSFMTEPANASARINLWAFGTTTAWLISQPIDLGVTPGDYRVAFDMGATAWNTTSPPLTDIGTHNVDVIVSTDGGSTWDSGDIIASYTGAGTYDGSNVAIDLTTYSGVVKIAFVCTYNTTSPDTWFWIDDFEVEEIPTCFVPTALTTANITTDGVDISWTAPTMGTPIGYEYEISTSATPGTGTVVAGTSVTGITGLMSGTEYYLHVRTSCVAPGDYSEWVSTTFTTIYENPFCNPSGVAIPDNQCGSNELEQQVLVSGITGTLGNEVILNKVALNITHTWDGDLTITLISPSNTAVVLSDGNGGSGDNYGGTGCNNTPTNFRMDAATAVTAGSAPFSGDYLPEGDFADFDGEDPNGLWTLRVCDGASGDNGVLVYYRLQIIPPPTCFAPVNLAVSGLAPEQATVTWDPGSGTPGPSSYQFYYNTTGIAPDETTVPTGPATGLSIFLNTLTPGTHYYFWVRSDCGLQQSEWSSVIEFDTPLPNDLCTGATEVVCGGSYNDDCTTASAEVVPGSSGSTGPGLWYKFIGNGGDVTFETCNGVFFDSEINVFTGSCGSLTNVGSNDDACSNMSRVTVSTTAGTEYFIYVSSWASFAAGGPYTLDVICSGYWTGAISSDWATAGNWSSGAVPGTGENAVIPSSPSGGNFPDVSAGAPINNLIVQSGANIDIVDGASVTVEGDLTLDGVINISNDGSLVQETGSGLSGSGYVNVTKNGSTTGYDYWSSPVINGGLGAYYGFNSANSTIDPSDDDNDPGWFQTGGAIPTAKGGAFYAAGTRVFTGVPHNGTQNIGVTDNAPPADDWDLLGNPYPSGVDIAAWVAANSGVITGGMSFWDVDAYATHNGLTGNNFQSTGPNTTAANGILGSCQGFMAKAIASSNVTFTNAMRVADNSSELYRLAQIQQLKVSAVSAVHGPNQTTVGFYDNSLDGVDGFDSPKLGILADISLYSWIAGSEYAINFMAPLASTVEIPLGMNTNVATNVTFTLDEFTDMDNEFIYLEDRVAGVFTNLKDNDYVFAASAMHYVDRFYLHVSTSAITGIEEQADFVGMNAYVADEMLNVFSTEEVAGDLEVLDMSGKVVLTRSGMIVGPNGIQLSLSALSDGVYMVRLVGEDANMTQKVLK